MANGTEEEQTGQQENGTDGDQLAVYRSERSPRWMTFSKRNGYKIPACFAEFCKNIWQWQMHENYYLALFLTRLLGLGKRHYWYSWWLETNIDNEHWFVRKYFGNLMQLAATVLCIFIFNTTPCRYAIPHDSFIFIPNR